MIQLDLFSNMESVSDECGAKLVRFRLNSKQIESPIKGDCDEQLVIQWTNLSYRVATKSTKSAKSGEKLILKQQSGVVKGGELLALMGE